MTDFVVTITDPSQLAGIAWARERHNAELTTPPPPEGEEPPAPPEGLCATDADYVRWVLYQAALSYAQQQRDEEWREAYEAEKAQRA
jgi:hypothetical protein